MAVPYAEEEANPESVMEIGIVTRKNSVLSPLGAEYIAEIQRYLGIEA